MANVNIFQDPSKSLPKRDEQIVRVNMEELEIGGRKAHVPGEKMGAGMAIQHVPNAGGKH
jgi:hypothetical protein